MPEVRVANICPRCGQMLYASASQYELSWDDRHKRFEVTAKFECGGCGASTGGNVIKLLPVYIEEGSSCSCGEELVLKSHKMTKSGDDIIFEGVYQCDSCNEKKEVKTGGIKESVRNIWSRVSKVQVGPIGIEIKREDD